MHAPEPWTRVRVETPTYYVYQIHSPVMGTSQA